MNRRRWLGLSLAGIAGAGALGALGALLAAPALGGPRGWLGHGGRFGHGHGGEALDEPHVRAHVAWLLRGVDASDAQLDEITRIATETASELRALRGAQRRAHGEIGAALGGGSVDRAALETLRAEHVAALDDASRKLADALARAAEVLSPAQRAALVAQHEKLRALHGAE